MADGERWAWLLAVADGGRWLLAVADGERWRMVADGGRWLLAVAEVGGVLGGDEYFALAFVHDPATLGGVGYDG